MIASPEWMHPLVRPLNWGDLDRIIEIELAAYPFPWSRGIFADCLRVGYDCWGLQMGKQLVGYCIQTEAAGETHLLNLCVAPEWQGRGFGSLLLEHTVRIARSHRCSCVFLEVRPSNAAGIALYEKHGFSVIGRRPGYYTAGPAPLPEPADSAAGELPRAREDALVMKLEL